MEALPDQHNPSLPIVLIVEDNASVSKVIHWSLQFGGFQPVEAANGLEALQWMEQAAREQRFAALILLDLAMPGMNGHAFISWLQTSWQTHYPVPPVIVLTALHSIEDTTSFPSFVTSIVAKPFHISDLTELIRATTT